MFRYFADISFAERRKVVLLFLQLFLPVKFKFKLNYKTQVFLCFIVFFIIKYLFLAKSFSELTSTFFPFISYFNQFQVISSILN